MIRTVIYYPYLYSNTWKLSHLHRVLFMSIFRIFMIISTYVCCKKYLLKLITRWKIFWWWGLITWSRYLYENRLFYYRISFNKLLLVQLLLSLVSEQFISVLFCFIRSASNSFYSSLMYHWMNCSLYHQLSAWEHTCQCYIHILQLITSRVSCQGHMIVELQFFETVARYEKFFLAEPQLIPDVLVR